MVLGVEQYPNAANSCGTLSPWTCNGEIDGLSKKQQQKKNPRQDLCTASNN